MGSSCGQGALGRRLLYRNYYFMSAIGGWFATGVNLFCNLISNLVALCYFLVRAVFLVFLALATVGWIAVVGVTCSYVAPTLYASCGFMSDPFGWIVAVICYYIISTIYDWIYYVIWNLLTITSKSIGRWIDWSLDWRTYASFYEACRQFISNAFRGLRMLWEKKFQLLTLAMIVFSALMVWKVLICVTEVSCLMNHTSSLNIIFTPPFSHGT